MAAEQPEFDLLWGYNAAVRSNAFVADADEYGVARWETVVGVVPLPSQSLDERKAVVLAKINEQLPYTVRALESMLEGICGADNYNVTVYANDYLLDVQIMAQSQNCSSMVQSLLWRVVPCNLIYCLTDIYETDLACTPLHVASLLGRGHKSTTIPITPSPSTLVAVARISATAQNITQTILPQPEVNL